MKPAQKINKPTSLFGGLFKRNTLVLSGCGLSVAVLGSSTVSEALIIGFVFSLVTFFSIIISSFIPRTISYTIRIILYAIIASLIFIPVQMFGEYIFGESILSLGTILPVIIVNPLILIKSELRFYRRTKVRMVADVFFYIVGFDLILLIIAFIRELLGLGLILGQPYGAEIIIPILNEPSGAFMLIALLGALVRWIYVKYASKRADF